MRIRYRLSRDPGRQPSRDEPTAASITTTTRTKWPALSSRDLRVPVDVVVVHPREGFTAGNAPEDQGHHKVAQHAGDGAGGLAVARPRTVRDDAFHPGPAQPLVDGEGLPEIRQVAQASGEHHGILDGHGRAASPMITSEPLYQIGTEGRS